MIEVNNKFNLDEECYTYYPRNIEIPCPVCNGTKYLKINNYEIRCRQCNNSGKIELNNTFLDVCKVKITRIKTSISDSNILIKYVVEPVDKTINVKNRNENSLFKTKDEAFIYCKEKNEG